MGGEKFPRGKSYMNLVKALNPVREDGEIDHRYVGLAKQIVQSVSSQTISQLNEFKNRTDTLEQEYSRPGLRLAIAVFSQEMEDWQKKAFKKQLRHTLQKCGFKPSMTAKLIGAGEFVAERIKYIEYNPDFDGPNEDEYRKEHQDNIRYLSGYGVTGLYTLSRMDGNGYFWAKELFSERGRYCTQKELEAILQEHPRWTGNKKNSKGRRVEDESDDRLDVSYRLLTEALDSGEITDEELFERAIKIMQAINWESLTEARMLDGLGELARATNAANSAIKKSRDQAVEITAKRSD